MDAANEGVYMKYKIEINGKVHEVDVEEKGPGYRITVNGVVYEARIEEVRTRPDIAVSESVLRPVPPVPVTPIAPTPPSATPGVIVAPMPGTVLKVRVSPGDTVNVGDVLLMLEAMKMENEISSHVSGTVKAVYVKEGQSVNTNDRLLVIS
jgi:biotin carboxyl carrier protein